MSINILDLLVKGNGLALHERQTRALINGDTLSNTAYAIVLSVKSSTLLDFEPATGQQNTLYEVTARVLKPAQGQSSRHCHEPYEDPCIIINDADKKNMLTALHTKFIGELPDKGLQPNDIVEVEFTDHTFLNEKVRDVQFGILKKKINSNAIGIQRSGASIYQICEDIAASDMWNSGTPMSVVAPPPVVPPSLSSFLSTSEYESDGGPVIKKAKELGFETFDKEPFRMFIFGIRGPNRTVDSFDDTLGVAYIDDTGKWNLHYYIGTTDPGAYYTTRTKDGESVATSIMAEGQYIDAYQIGKHRGKYDALKQVGSVDQYLDRSGDSKLDFTGKHATPPGRPGLNIHASVRGGPGKTATRVGKYSAGCQVHATSDGFESMMTLARLQVQKIGKKDFTYTLMDQWFGGVR